MQFIFKIFQIVKNNVQKYVQLNLHCSNHDLQRPSVYLDNVLLQDLSFFDLNFYSILFIGSSIYVLLDRRCVPE